MAKLTGGDSLLKRNGWVQVTEWDLTFRSATGNSDALQALREWSQLHAQSLGASNRPQGRKRGRVTQDCEAWMRMAGFVDVSADIRDIPTCPWPTGMLSMETGCMDRGADLYSLQQIHTAGPLAKQICPT